MARSIVKAERFKIRPRARLVETIGEDLIKDELAGIIELVKNGFDADAGKVTIEFVDLLDPIKATIVISDTGHGMTKEVVTEHWLSPSTDRKREQRTSPKGRPLLGRKGVGRFSAMRLGRHLVLETTPKKGDTTRVAVDWEPFKSGRTYLDELDVEVETYPRKGGQKRSGTSLTIRGLQDQWDDRRIRKLLKELRRLLSPVEKEQESQRRFKIAVDLRRSGIQSDLRKLHTIEPYDLPQLADYVVSAIVNADGTYSISYSRKLYANKDKIEVTDERPGFDIRKIFPEFNKQEEQSGIPLPLPCGKLQMQFYIWDRDVALLEAKAPDLKSDSEQDLTVADVRRILDERSGVAIYRDGFRVRPYGDPDQDWLELAQARVQSKMRIGPNQLFGIVNISSTENPSLEDKSSREGLKENVAFTAMRLCVRGVLGEVEPIRFRFRERHHLGRPTPHTIAEVMVKREEALTQLQKKVEEIPDKTLRQHVQNLARRAEELVSEEHDRLAQQTELMHDFHALGILAKFVLHEGRTIDTSLDAAVSSLERTFRKTGPQLPARIVVEGPQVDIVLESTDSCREAEQRLDSLLDQLDPLTRPRRGRRPKIDITETIDHVKTVLAPDLRHAGVTISTPQKPVIALAWESDVFHAVFNLVANSMFWSAKTDAPHWIKVSTRHAAKDKIEITVADSGPGVKEASANHIFDLGYSEKPDGTGVGLFIAREAIQRSFGTIELQNPGEPGAKFRILLEAAE